MTAKFDWNNSEKTIGRYDLDAHWTWEELHQVMSQSWVQIAKQDNIIDSIMISKSRSFPSNVMPHLSKLAQNRPSNTGIMVVVGTSVFQRSMIQMFTRIYSSTLGREVPFVFADSLEEAQQILVQKQYERTESAG